MVQPLRSDERSLPKPVSFRVTQAEQDALDRCVVMFGLAKEGADLGPHRGEACRRLAAAAVNGVILADVTDADRAKLDRLVAAHEAQLARIGVQGLRPTRSSVLLSLLRAAPEPGEEPPARDIKAFITSAPEHEAAVREAHARETAAVDPAPPAPTAAHEAPAPAELPPVDALQAALTAAHEAGETLDGIASAIDVKPATLRTFRSAGRGIGAAKLQKLADVLRKGGHLQGT